MRYIWIAVLLLTGCPPPPPNPIPDVTDTEVCPAAEARLEELQCKDRKGDPMWVNKRGEHFADTCKKAQEEGGIFVNPRCISTAQSCEEAKACPPE